MALWVKDLALSLLWLGSQLWRGLDPWPGNFHMPWTWQKKKEGRKEKGKKERKKIKMGVWKQETQYLSMLALKLSFYC